MTKYPIRNLILTALTVLVLGFLLFVQRKPEPIAESRYVEPDRLYQAIVANVRSHPEFEVIADIDHSRLGAGAGSPMPPSHVLIWSDPILEASILKHNPVAAVDLPLRILAYEEQSTGEPAVIYNRYGYVARRHSLPQDASLRDGYESAFSTAMGEIPEGVIKTFPSDELPAAGLVTLTSPYDFSTTKKRIQDAIQAQSDTVSFAEVDFAARSKAHGVELRPLHLILFGGPGPGGKAMASAPTLGLDAFCQKLVIWQDENETVHVTFNDLLALATRQNVSVGLPLRVINRRVKETFSAALEP